MAASKAKSVELELFVTSLNRMGSLFDTLSSNDDTESTIKIHRYQNFVEDHDDLYQKELELRRQHCWPIDNSRMEEYAESDKHNIHFVAIKSDAVIGTVQYQTELNRLRQMVVDPSYRGCGLGSKLVQKVKEESKQIGNDILKVNSLQTSQLFYAKNGFIADGKPYESKGVFCQKMYCKLTS